MAIRYEVQSRNNGKAFAVQRWGKQGGLKVIAVYRNQYVAETVCKTLQLHSINEK